MSTTTPPSPEAAPTPDAALVAALAKAQGAFPRIERSNTATIPSKNGKAGYTYSYADLGEVLGAVRPVLSEHELAIVQRTHHDAGKAILVTELRHAGGGLIDSTVELGQSTSSPQQFGAALTYLRRYELVTLLGIAAEEDRDAQDVEQPGRGGGAAPLPGWAAPATNARKVELVEALDPLIGSARAKAVGASVAGSLGTVPDVVVATAKLIAGELMVAGPVADLLREAVLDHHVDLAAKALDVERQAAVEAPGERASTDEGHEEAIADAAQAAAEEPEPTPEELAKPTTEAPGTVYVGEKAADESVDAYVARLRAAGCKCEDPLGDKVADDCPVRGHGLPF